MDRIGRLAGWVAMAGLLGTAAGAQPSPSADPQSGQALALSVCTECHLVSADQPELPARKPPAPSFREIANRPGVSAKSLRTFLLTTHRAFEAPPNMPRMWLSDDEAASVAAYILSLKTRP